MKEGDAMTGVVKWFNKEKGYGFIVPDGEQKEIFCHITRVKKGQPDLIKDMRVDFVIKQGNQGPMANNVEIIG